MPHALTYDTLPPHSALQREVIGDMIKITAAAEEPNAYARRAELQRAALAGALLCGALLAAFILAIGSMYLSHRRYMNTATFAILCIAFVIFCVALFLMMWKMQYTGRIDALTRALRQTTILAASPGKLLIETAGPFGQASHELIGSIVNFRAGRCGSERPVRCLEILLNDGRTVQVLPGRDESELRWVTRTLRATIGI